MIVCKKGTAIIGGVESGNNKNKSGTENKIIEK